MSTESRSIWSSVRTPAGHEKLPTFYDVCVVGAGIAGLTTAYHLLEEGVTVGILDARPRTSQGETLYTTAHLSSVIDDRFKRLIAIRGKAHAGHAYQSHAAAIDTIERIAGEENIDCDFQRVDGYLYLGEEDDIESLDEEEKAIRDLGIPHERLRNVAGIVSRPCLRFPRQGQFHPLKYMAGLARVIEARGGVFHTDTRITAIEGGDLVTLTTQDERTIMARYVVVATNSPLNAGIILSTKLAAYQTYVFAAPIVGGTFPRGLYWDTLDPYHYVRMQTMQMPAGMIDYVIVGGEDHKTGQADDAAERWNLLESWARREFTGFEIGSVEYRWSGEVLETLDGVGLIGKQPGGPDNVFIATGDSGMGMTHGTIAGMMLPHLILGRGHPWEELYDPRRTPIGAAATYVAENFNSAAQFTDWVTGGDKQRDEVHPGESAIVRRGLRKLAVHCEPNGTCHTFSAKCPHMGAIVHWNDAEGTWDCPAHGSRFTATGKVIHGPAVDDLEPAEEEAVAGK